MIKKLTVKNFQKLKDRTFEFTEGINVIIGPSDTGKSATFRSMQSLFLNSFNLLRKRTHGSKGDVVIECEGDFGEVKRIRGNTKNEYWLNNKRLKACGQGKIDDVIEFTGISSLNFQSQHEKAFLLNCSSGEVAKELNKIVNMEVIDFNLSKLVSEEKEATKEFKFIENEISEQKKELKQLKVYKEMSERIDIINEIEEDIAAVSERFETLEKILDNLDEAYEKLEQLKEIHVKSKKIIEIHSNKIELEEKAETLEETLEELENLKLKLVPDEIFERIEKIKLLNIEQYGKNEDKTNLNDIIFKTEKFKEEIQNLDEEIRELDEKLHTEFKTCPLCGGKL